MNLPLPPAKIPKANKIKLGNIPINIQESSSHNVNGSTQALNNLEQAIRQGVFSGDTSELITMDDSNDKEQNGEQTR